MRDIALLIGSLSLFVLRRMLSELDRKGHAGRDDWQLIKSEISYRTGKDI